MNTEDLRFQEALGLYENGNYAEAGQLALELVNEGIRQGDAFLLFTKSYLFMIFDPSDEESLETFYNAVRDTLCLAKTSEEYFYFRSEIEYTFNEWNEKIIKNAIDVLEKEASLDIWKVFIYYPANISKIWLITSMNMNSVPVPESNPETAGEFPEKEIDNDFTTEKCHSLIYNVACEIFENTKEELENEQHSSAEHCQYLVDKIIRGLTLSRLMVDYSIPDLNDEDDKTDIKTIISRLKTLANIREYKLNAMLYPNGNPMSLYQSGRHDISEELSNTYRKIKELDPTFEIPLLPSVQAITLPQVNNASGGCYIATAVYGSYDCPEVWTLRRYRDDVMANTCIGRIFIRSYYAISPTIVKWFGKTLWFRNFFRTLLDKKVEKLNSEGIENTKYQDKEW